MRYQLLFVLSFISIATYSQDYAKAESSSTTNDTVKNKKGEILNEVLITTNKPKKPIEAARSGIKVMDLPQSVQIIGSEIIEEQRFRIIKRILLLRILPFLKMKLLVLNLRCNESHF